MEARRGLLPGAGLLGAELAALPGRPWEGATGVRGLVCAAVDVDTGLGSV